MRHAGYLLVVLAMVLGFATGFISDPIDKTIIGTLALVWAAVGVFLGVKHDNEAREEWGKIINKVIGRPKT